MGRAVVFDDVRDRIAEFGECASLISVTDGGTPHAVSVLVEVTDGRLLARVGSRTRANLLARPGLSLLWHERPGGEYQLIVDGRAEAVGDEGSDGLTPVSVVVQTGILHRLAGLTSAGATCVSLDAG